MDIFKEKALLMIQEICANHTCDCLDEEKTAQPNYYCPTCHIYGIAHAALGCGAEGCPVVIEHTKEINEWREN